MNELKMQKMEKKELPYFPLNVALLPGEDIPLRVFEPRYKQLIDECNESGKTFGIPFISDNKMQSFGSEVKIRQVVAKNSKGEMVITVEGVSNFEVESFKDPVPGKLYSGGKIQPVNLCQVIKNPDLIKILISYTDHVDPSFLKKVQGNEILMTDVAAALNLSSNDKYHFISSGSDQFREQFLLGQMKYLIKLREQERLLNNDYHLN